MPGRALPTRDTTDPASHQPGRGTSSRSESTIQTFAAMLHPSDEAFAFDERRQLGEITSIVCSRARSAYLAEACTGRPEHLPSGAHVPNVMGTWPTEP